MNLNDLENQVPPYDVDAVEFRDANIVIHFALPGDVQHPVVKRFTTMSIGPHQELQLPVTELLDAVYHLIDEAITLERDAPQSIRSRR